MEAHEFPLRDVLAITTGIYRPAYSGNALALFNFLTWHNTHLNKNQALNLCRNYLWEKFPAIKDALSDLTPDQQKILQENIYGPEAWEIFGSWLKQQAIKMRSATLRIEPIASVKALRRPVPPP